MTTRHKLAGLLFLAVGTFTSTGCSAFQPDQINTTGLTIVLSVRANSESPSPVARIEIENVSERQVAFSKTFGITNGPWLRLHIEASDGRRIYYPMEVDLFDPPSYRCLSPGERIVWEIDLLDWNVEVGGKARGEENLSFDLPPGQYRAQASYSEPAGTRARCAAINGVSKSDWVLFETE